MKICQAENCNYPVFGGGYCKYHQSKRTDGKKPHSLQYQIPKKKDPSELLFSFGYDNQVQMFGDLWHDEKKKNGWVTCPFTGEPLEGYKNTNLYWSCFAHILGKGKYPYFKLNPANIRIVHPNFHKICDQGTQADRAKHPNWRWDLWDAEVEKMKEEYQNFKKVNLLP